MFHVIIIDVCTLYVLTTFLLAVKACKGTIILGEIHIVSKSNVKESPF
jgi:hypothetical protein